MLDGFKKHWPFGIFIATMVIIIAVSVATISNKFKAVSQAVPGSIKLGTFDLVTLTAKPLPTVAAPTRFFTSTPFPTNLQPTNPFPSATAPPIVNIAPTDSPADPTPQSSHPHKPHEIGNPHDNAGSSQ